MGPLLQQFAACLDRGECAWEEAGEGALTTSAEGDDELFGVIVQADEDTQQLACYVILPVEAPPERRQAVAELVTRANFGLLLGNLELDFDDGEVRVKTAIDCEGLELGDTTWVNLFNTALELASRYLPALRRVLDGALPAVALGEAEA